MFLPENADNFILHDGNFVNQEGEVLIDSGVLKELGYSFDNEGNVIDPVTNTVIKDKIGFLTEYYSNESIPKPSPVKKEVTPSGDDIIFDKEKGYITSTGELAFNQEGVKFNENGDIVDDEGKVIKTKEDVIKWYKDNTSDTAGNIIEEIISLTGIKVFDEKGNPISFENSKEGLVQFVTSVYKQAEETAKNEAILSFLKANPDVYDMALYKQKNGSLEGYGTFVDYTTISLSDDDVDTMKDVVIKYQMLLNQTTDKSIAKKAAESYADYLEKEGTLKGQAEIALKALRNIQEENQKKIIKEHEEREKAEEEAITKYINTLKEKIISNGKIDLGNNEMITIPEKIYVRKDGKIITYNREDFFNYFVTPKYTIKSTGEQLTQFEYDERNLPNRLDLDLYRAYLLFTGMSEADIVKSKVENTKALNLQELVNGKNKQKTLSIFDVPSENRGGVKNIRIN